MSVLKIKVNFVVCSYSLFFPASPQYLQAKLDGSPQCFYVNTYIFLLLYMPYPYTVNSLLLLIMFYSYFSNFSSLI